MTTISWLLFAGAAAVAVVDWVAVARRPSPVETVAKPLVMVAFIAAAITLDPADEAQRWWFVAALVLSLAGDVFLLPSVDRFVPGLGSFLLAHLAYIVGFVTAGRGTEPLAGAAFYGLLIAIYALPIVRGVRRTEPQLLGPVLAYMIVIASMLVAAYWHGDRAGIGGALLFVVSDATLATGRFVGGRRWTPALVIVTYHLAQSLLVLSLA